MSPLRLALLTLLALVSFAANSVWCRLALGRELIDPVTYTLVRLATGALTLALLSRAWRGSWRAAFLLFLYAAPFSLAYVELTTGTGALIAFTFVQLTMIAGGVISGRHPSAREWIGVALASTGLYVLVRPGLAAPSPTGGVLMATAGVAWGLYSLVGRGSSDPLRDTAANFARASVLAVVMWLLALALHLHAGVDFGRWFDEGAATPAGLLLATISGAITSAIGYVIWYAALPGLSPARAALVQTAVPLLSALAGIVFLGETATSRLLLAAAIIVGGILLTIPRARATLGR